MCLIFEILKYLSRANNCSGTLLRQVSVQHTCSQVASQPKHRLRVRFIDVCTVQLYARAYAGTNLRIHVVTDISRRKRGVQVFAPALTAVYMCRNQHDRVRQSEDARLLTSLGCVSLLQLPLSAWSLLNRRDMTRAREGVRRRHMKICFPFKHTVRRAGRYPLSHRLKATIW